jgi:hypothetical protein
VSTDDATGTTFTASHISHEDNKHRHKRAKFCFAAFDHFRHGWWFGFGGKKSKDIGFISLLYLDFELLTEVLADTVSRTAHH